jgi:hypothetical protein
VINPIGMQEFERVTNAFRTTRLTGMDGAPQSSFRGFAKCLRKSWSGSTGFCFVTINR